MRFVLFSYYKTANRTAPCGAVHYYLRCSAVMPFCGRFWCVFCSLVNTPTGHYHREERVKFRLEEHHLQVRDP